MVITVTVQGTVQTLMLRRNTSVFQRYIFIDSKGVAAFCAQQQNGSNGGRCLGEMVSSECIFMGRNCSMYTN